jgi:hypothetical protein
VVEVRLGDVVLDEATVVVLEVEDDESSVPAGAVVVVGAAVVAVLGGAVEVLKVVVVAASRGGCPTVVVEELLVGAAAVVVLPSNTPTNGWVVADVLVDGAWTAAISERCGSPRTISMSSPASATPASAYRTTLNRYAAGHSTHHRLRRRRWRRAARTSG